MAKRTFGWIQDAYTIKSLKKVVQLFLLDSPINILLREDKIPRLVAAKDGRDEFIKELSQNHICIPYVHLKGRGVKKGNSRTKARCSGIVQAVLPGQRREYQGDWSADSYLRWAISIGFIEYDRENDMCSISELGTEFAKSIDGSEDENHILTRALLSYPPVCRVLLLLKQNEHMTKFEIGDQLGFIGEAGFTSIPQRLILQGLSETTTEKERSKILSNTEGTSDKYVRTICSWLEEMGWVQQEAKLISAKIGDSVYVDSISHAYKLTLNGLKITKHINGTSKFGKIPKRIMWEMLATKAVDRDYIRNRRAYIIQALNGSYKTTEFIIKFLNEKGLNEDKVTIEDDIKGLIKIGISILKNKNTYKITDEIVGLEIPNTRLNKSNYAIIKDEIRKKLTYVDHKYLMLIDLGFENKLNRDYEIQTAELLTNELDFKGARLGEARKPDVCVYYENNGLIIDNKAYSKGYSLPISQADEMVRYIEENKEREPKINPNKWWEVFDSSVTEFNFAFVSGEFVGGFKERIHNIYERTNICGGAINSINLLLLAEELKTGRINYEQCFELFKRNEEIKMQWHLVDDVTVSEKVAEEIGNFGNDL